MAGAQHVSRTTLGASCVRVAPVQRVSVITLYTSLGPMLGDIIGQRIQLQPTIKYGVTFLLARSRTATYATSWLTLQFPLNELRWGAPVIRLEQSTIHGRYNV